MTNTALLEARIQASGYKKSYIAKVLGLTRAGLASKIQGLTEFKASEISALCDLLRIDDWQERDQIFFAR